MERAHISCEFIHDSVINYAMQQNHVPLVKRLCLINNGSNSFEQIELSIATEPEFAAPWNTTISSLGLGQRIDLGVFDRSLIIR